MSSLLALLLFAYLSALAASASVPSPAAATLAAAAARSSVESLRLDIIHGLSAAPAGDVASLESALENALARVHEARAASSQTWPVAVIGGGLSGLTASLRLLEAGMEVTLIDKRGFMGGNSAKASSGINGCKTGNQNELGIEDSAPQFYADTMKCSRRSVNVPASRPEHFIVSV